MEEKVARLRVFHMSQGAETGRERGNLGKEVIVIGPLFLTNAFGLPFAILEPLAQILAVEDPECIYRKL